MTTPTWTALRWALRDRRITWKEAVWRAMHW